MTVGGVEAPEHGPRPRAERCACGQGLRRDARWCPRCLEPVARPPSRFDPPHAPVPAQLPSLAELEEAEAVRARQWRAQFSRTRGGPTSFGLRGRLIATGCVIWVALWALIAGAVLFLAMWLLVSVLVLRDIWKLERQPPPPGARSLTSDAPALRPLPAPGLTQPLDAALPRSHPPPSHSLPPH